MKILSVSDARRNFSSAINWSEKNNDDVLIKSRGEAKAVIIPYADYELLQEAREKQRKRKAVEDLKALAEQIRIAADLSDEEAENLAEEISQEAIQGLMAKGDVVFSKSE